MAISIVTKSTLKKLLSIIKKEKVSDAPLDDVAYMRKNGEWVPCNSGSIPDDILQRLEKIENQLNIPNDWILADGIWNNDKSWNNMGFWNNGKKE